MKNHHFLLSTTLLLFALTGTQRVHSQTEARWNGNAYTSLVTTSSSTSDDKIIYLYNVKEGRFVINGGYWGTHAMLYYQDYGIPMKLLQSSGVYNLETTVNTAGTAGTGTYFGAVKDTLVGDGGWFCDRGYYAGYSGNAITFSRVEDASNTSTYTYRISTVIKDTTYYLSSNGRVSAMVDTVPGTEGQWRLVTRNQLNEVLSATDADAYSGLNADMTYLIKGASFGRNDTDAQNYWTTSSSGSASDKRFDWRARTDSATSSSWNAFVRTIEGGTTADKADRLNGSYYNCSLEGIGKVYQTITVPKAGWYKLTCQGFFAGSASNLYVKVSGGETKSVPLYDASNDFPVNDTVKVVLVTDNNSAYAIRSVINLRNADRGLTAGKRFADGSYPNEIWFYADKDGTSVEIGVEKTAATVSGTTETCDYKKTTGSNWNTTTTYYYHDADYTAIDNFQLKFIGAAPFILDEDKESTDYMNETFTNRTMLLNRSFTLNSWNSLVLPIDMTSAQVKQAFGDDVELARLEGLDETNNMVIKFASIDLPAEGNAIAAGHLYIIKPTKAAASAPFEIDGTTYSKACYTLGRRNFNGEAVVAAGTEVIECKRTQESHPNDIVAYGTFVKLNNDGDNACPAGAYVFSGGNMYNTVSALPIKGFRGWIEDTQLSAGAKSFRVSVDGQSDVTAVDGVKLNIPTVIDGRVYDMSGRLVRTDGSIKELPAGIYIVNHKKVVKK